MTLNNLSFSSLKTLSFSKLKTSEKILSVAGFFLLFHIVFMFTIYPPFLRSMVHSQKSLKMGNEVRDYYLKLPVPLVFRVYFFNISNPEEVLSGGKPILTEVGPFCYDAYKEKIDILDDKEKDTITYTPYETYFFNEECSGKNSQDDYVTVLNPLAMAMIITVSEQKPQYLRAIGKVLKILFKENGHMYITAKARELLFDGIAIDCNVKDIAAGAVCTQFKALPSFRELSKNVYGFSLLGSRNGSIPKRITTNRGIKKAKNLGKVYSIDNETDLKVWSDNTCNKLEGTDGWIFPSFLKEDAGLWSVAPDLCRSFEAKFIEKFRYKGVPVRKYTVDLGDMSSNPNEKCFCPPSGCLPKGVMSLMKCIDAPIQVTLPHCLHCDSKLLEEVDGLRPNVDNHSIVLFFEPITATPLFAQRRIQFNLQMEPVAKIEELAHIRSMLHPIFWLEEGLELDGFLLKRITSTSGFLQFVDVYRYVGILIYLGIMGFGGYKYWKDWKLDQVSPAEQTSVKSANLTNTVNHDAQINNNQPPRYTTTNGHP